MKWEGDVRHDLKVLNALLWKKQSKIRNEWKRIIKRAKTVKEL